MTPEMLKPITTFSVLIIRGPVFMDSKRTVFSMPSFETMANFCRGRPVFSVSGMVERVKKLSEFMTSFSRVFLKFISSFNFPFESNRAAL